MARIRTIKPLFWADEKLGTMQPIDRLVYIGLWSMADDEGRLLDNVKQIDAFIFPYTDHRTSSSLNRLAESERIIRYEAPGGLRLIQIVRWTDHQRIAHPTPSSFPAPPEQLVKNSRKPRERRASGAGAEAETFVPGSGSGEKELSNLPGIRALTSSREQAVAESNARLQDTGNDLELNDWQQKVLEDALEAVPVDLMTRRQLIHIARYNADQLNVVVKDYRESIATGDIRDRRALWLWLMKQEGITAPHARRPGGGSHQADDGVDRGSTALSA